MRIVYFGNNWTGWQVLSLLRGQGHDIAGLVVHPQDTRTYGEQILDAAGLEPELVFDGSRLAEPAVHQAIAELDADIGLSVFFAHIIKPPLLEVFPQGILNLHPGLLPYNRGVFANVWSIVESTPAGATLHYVDQGVDTGDIVAQREVPVRDVDTGETLYRRLERACVDLFSEAWPSVADGTAVRTPQDPSAGSTHPRAQIADLDAIDPAQTYTAQELIDLLRARTFAPHKGAYLQKSDKRIYLSLKLEEE